MLLLYPGDYPESENESTIYIRLFFYFIVITPDPLLIQSQIYIPLCFYFIVNAAAELTRYLNLHSTMLLLYLNDSPRAALMARIYIPLCFYFITVVRKQIQQQK